MTRRNRQARLASTLAALALVATACTGGGDVLDEPLEATGVLIEMVGNLQGVESFTIRLGDGSTLTLVPEADLLFHAAPLSHLREHLASGLPVHVIYVVDDNGAALALEVGHG